MPIIPRSIVVLHLLSLLVLGQDGAKTVERDLWKTRADAVTTNLLKEAATTDALNKALLLARLGELWWESDQRQAGEWIEKSVDTISFYPADDIKTHSETYFAVARQVLGIVAARNKKQADRLSDLLSKSEDGSAADKGANSDALIEQALRIVKDDPQSAAALGLHALNLGSPVNVDQLSWALRRYDVKLANQFFRAALANLSANPTTPKLNAMETIAFPEHRIAKFPAALQPPPELKILFLNFAADYIIQSQLRLGNNTITSCMNEAIFTIKLEAAFNQFLRQKSEAVKQAVNICLGKRSQQVRDLVDPADAADVESFMNKADQSQDQPMLRGNYLLKATSAAMQQKQFDRAIEILDRMRDDEKKVNQDYWDQMRWDAGALLAVARFNEGDVAGAQQILRDIPERLRPLGKITFVLQFPADSAASYQLSVDLLNDARSEIGKSSVSFRFKSSYWLALVKLYADFKLSSEAADTLQELVVAFNGARSDDAGKNLVMANQLVSDAKRLVPKFSSSLLDAKESAILQSISLLNDQKSRTEINLQFLKMMLAKYQALKAETDKAAAANAARGR
jgi:hypothetical protein